MKEKLAILCSIWLCLGVLSFGQAGQDNSWSEEFQEVEIASSIDSVLQKAYFYRSGAGHSAPLIVSLHTWSGDYSQEDPLASLCLSRDLNYIHPDFRGVNNSPEACCSALALGDIDDAISYAIQNARVDSSRIYVLGNSGGGYATLAAFMKSKHRIRSFSAWVPISDLVAWYRESHIRGNKYAEDILHCTGSEDSILQVSVARQRSPLYWETPVSRLDHASLFIYTGVYDGIQGSVPITQSINFYNKLLTDLSVGEASAFVSDQEILHLLEHRSTLGDFGEIADRAVFLKKQYGRLKLVVFQGNHEMLYEYALNEVIAEQATE